MQHDAFGAEQEIDTHKTKAPETWGIAMGLRSAAIVFDADQSVVNDVLPLIFYDNGRLFIDGLEAGYRLFQGNKWQLSPLARYRFFDISSEVQDRSTEYVLAVKFYYTIKLPTLWRLGFAEGLSYADKIPYLEEKDMEEKGYRSSQLLNFLDFSIDLSLGHLFRVGWMEELWLGYSIHHRSWIFSKSSAFGRISGGSNYNTVYLQYHW